MQLVCVAWGFFCENKYLAQSDESDSEYREQQNNWIYSRRE
ncbi:hypothetical protein [Lachnobacterium bovis]|nr:hypothetical protein [Lachnobacterium bovis]